MRAALQDALASVGAVPQLKFPAIAVPFLTETRSAAPELCSGVRSRLTKSPATGKARFPFRCQNAGWALNHT